MSARRTLLSLPDGARSLAGSSAVRAGGSVIAHLPIEIVIEAVNYLKVREAERTRRTAIRAERDLALEEIGMCRMVFESMLEGRFLERGKALEIIWRVIDRSLEDRVADITGYLKMMVEIISQTPIDSDSVEILLSPITGRRDRRTEPSDDY